MIKAILVFNNHGKPRLSKFYQYFVSTRHSLRSLLLSVYKVYNCFCFLKIIKVVCVECNVYVTMIFILLCENMPK